MPAWRLKSASLFDVLLGLLAGGFFAFVILVLLALLTTISARQLYTALHSPLVFSAVVISLETSLLVLFFSVLFGLPVAYFLAL